tara:strand:- start:211 stop:603 length:393 start_codon:yes stop_codon:yes gene_type:complete
VSILKVGTIQDTNGANPSTAEQIANGRAKAWVKFTGDVGDGVAATKINDFNISSVTDVSVGLYQCNFSTDMPNTNYVVLIQQVQNARTNPNKTVIVPTGSHVTTSFRAEVNRADGGIEDCHSFFAAVFGD